MMIVILSMTNLPAPVPALIVVYLSLYDHCGLSRMKTVASYLSAA